MGGGLEPVSPNDTGEGGPSQGGSEPVSLNDTGGRGV